MHLTVPPLPIGVTQAEMELYEAEMREPTGIKLSLPTPPHYWEGVGLGGVLVADQCGWAFGLEGGKGVPIDDFWARSLNCESSMDEVFKRPGLIHRRRVCNCSSTPCAGPACAADGGHAHTVDTGKSLALDSRHHGRYGQLDLLRARRCRNHVGQQDQPANAGSRLPLPVFGYSVRPGRCAD